MKPSMSQDMFSGEWSLYFVNYVDGVEVPLTLFTGTEVECEEYMRTLERNV